MRELLERAVRSMIVCLPESARVGFWSVLLSLLALLLFVAQWVSKEVKESQPLPEKIGEAPATPLPSQKETDLS